MHIQQVSTESSSSIAEHDLTDLVASPCVTDGGAGESDYFNPRPPPKAILYASADSSAGHTNATTSHHHHHHPVSLIPTVSPPRYQLSLLSHPGSPPSRADTRFTSSSGGISKNTPNARHTRLRESYPPEARRAPPSPPPSSSHRALSHGSAPTVLNGNINNNDESVHGFDATWHSSPVDATSLSGGARDQRRILPPLHRHMTSVPEYNEVYARHDQGEPYEQHDDEAMLHDNRGVEPMTDEQHARITQGQYRLGVGYDDEHTIAAVDGGTGPGTVGKKKISEERRLERLRVLEREFGRVKNDNNRTMSRTAAEGALRESQEGRKSSAATLLSYSSNKDKDGKYERANLYNEGNYAGNDGNDDDNGNEISNEKMTFKQMRIREKQERARINRELGITKNGNLRTQGRKMRLSMRWCQGSLGLVAVISGLGGAFFTNPAKDDNLPPQGAISTWFLYIISLASFLCTCYLFTIQPFIRRRKSKQLEKDGHQHPFGLPNALSNMTANGIVLPIFSSPSARAYNAGKKMKAGRRGAFGKKMGKKGYMQQYHHQSQPMMVNLVVDPNMLAGAGLNTSKPPSRYDDSGFDDGDENAFKTRKTSNAIDKHQEEEEYDADEDHDFHIPNSTAKAEEAAKLRANQPLARMMDTMTIMKLQDKWREARRRMRKLAIIDACWTLVWFAESLFALGYGGSCKPGSGNGWCDTYNMALASGVLLCVAFSTSFVFDVLDLRRSRSTPRVSRTV